MAAAVYMLDTDISSYIMRRSNETLLRKLQSVPVDKVCVSVITQCELVFGIKMSPRPEKDQAALDGYLRHVEVLEYPAEAALHYAEIRTDLTHRGILIGSNDLFIAAHARCLGVTLVTNNIKEFKRVPRLKLENWTKSLG